MKVQIHHPRILILVLLVVGVLTTVAITVADLDRPVIETQSFSLPSPSTMLPPTDAEVAQAVSITRESGWVEAIAGKQGWGLIGPDYMGQPKWISIPGSDEYGIRFTALLENPVESDGPWHMTQCQVTRLREGYTTFRNILAINVIVDMSNRKPIVRSVLAPFHGDQEYMNPEVVSVPPGKETKIIRNTGTGDVLYNGTHEDMPNNIKECPPDLEDYKN